VPESVRQAAKALACGRADRAIELSEGERAEQLLELALRIDSAVETGKPGELIDLGEELSRSAELTLILETLALFYRDVSASCLGLEPNALSFKHRADLVQKRSDTIDARNAANRVDLIYRTCENLERNANKELSLDALLFDLGTTSFVNQSRAKT
jgi:hypothetical protein